MNVRDISRSLNKAASNVYGKAQWHLSENLVANPCFSKGEKDHVKLVYGWQIEDGTVVPSAAKLPNERFYNRQDFSNTYQTSGMQAFGIHEEIREKALVLLNGPSNVVEMVPQRARVTAEREKQMAAGYVPGLQQE